MKIETERKFLVQSTEYKKLAISAKRIKQGYVAHDDGRTVRVRIADDKAFITIKGPSLSGISRLEWEREIPVKDAEELFALCKPGIIDKTRYIVPNGARYFEVDEFYGDNEGLTVAEIELGEENEDFKKPSWLGNEVSGDPKYYNSQLIKNPFRNWGLNP